MPDSNTVALTQAAAAFAGDSVNAWSAAQTNKRQRQWQEKMYGWQRNDALADWNMQNEYNSPAKQMERLKAAGLNPALIYGSGGATAMSSSQPRSSSPGSWSPKAPEIHPTQAIEGYYNQKMQEALIRNADTKNVVMLADAAKKAGELDRLRIDTLKSRSQIKNIDQQTSQRESLLPIIKKQFEANIERIGGQTAVLASDKLLKDAQKLNVEMNTAKSEAEKEVILARNQREAIMQSYSIKEAVQRTLNLAQERENLRQGVSESEARERHARNQARLAEVETRIKELDEKMIREGKRPGDPMYMREVKDLLNKIQSGAIKLGGTAE